MDIASVTLTRADVAWLVGMSDSWVRDRMQAGDMPDTFADISAIQHDLGFAPSVGIDVGVPRFVEWYRGYTKA